MSFGLPQDPPQTDSCRWRASESSTRPFDREVGASNGDDFYELPPIMTRQQKQTLDNPLWERDIGDLSDSHRVVEANLYRDRILFLWFLVGPKERNANHPFHHDLTNNLLVQFFFFVMFGR